MASTDFPYEGQHQQGAPDVLEPQIPQADFAPLFNYLQSPNGHELASRIVTLVEEIKTSTLDRNAEYAKLSIWSQNGILVAVILSATILVGIQGKLDPTLAFLFGSLLGFAFGRKRG